MLVLGCPIYFWCNSVPLQTKWPNVPVVLALMSLILVHRFLFISISHALFMSLKCAGHFPLALGSCTIRILYLGQFFPPFFLDFTLSLALILHSLWSRHIQPTSLSNLLFCQKLSLICARVIPFSFLKILHYYIFCTDCGIKCVGLIVSHNLRGSEPQLVGSPTVETFSCQFFKFRRNAKTRRRVGVLTFAP